MKPYLTIPIKECHEPLVPIPVDRFAFFNPHVYQALGAPYGKASPWMLRQGVLEALLKVQTRLETERPGWKIKIFDAYRPNDVQAFMVEKAFAEQANKEGLAGFHNSKQLMKEAPELYEKLAENVFKLWGFPSNNPETPPPHSTGAAIDCTLQDDLGREIDMGSPIDENSAISAPDFFADKPERCATHENRSYLKALLSTENFRQHRKEWWHFSLGDQMWAWIGKEFLAESNGYSIYGNSDFIESHKVNPFCNTRSLES